MLEIRADIKQHKADIEKLDDATAELMMNSGGNVMLFMGESFVETSEDYATECKYLSSTISNDSLIACFFKDCERKQKSLQDKVDALSREETTIIQRQELLKKELYGRFGDNINLEN